MKFNQSFVNWCLGISIILACLTNIMQTFQVSALQRHVLAFQAEANRRLVEFGERPIEVKE